MRPTASLMEVNFETLRFQLLYQGANGDAVAELFFNPDPKHIRGFGEVIWQVFRDRGRVDKRRIDPNVKRGGGQSSAQNGDHDKS